MAYHYSETTEPKIVLALGILAIEEDALPDRKIWITQDDYTLRIVNMASFFIKSKENPPPEDFTLIDQLTGLRESYQASKEPKARDGALVQARTLIEEKLEQMKTFGPLVARDVDCLTLLGAVVSEIAEKPEAMDKYPVVESRFIRV